MADEEKDTLGLGLGIFTTGARTELALFDQDGYLLPDQVMNKIVVQDGPDGHLTVTQTFRVRRIINAKVKNSDG